MFTIQDYIDSLNHDKETLVENLTTKGVSASDSETFTTLVPKVLDITSVNNQSKNTTITTNGTTTITPDTGYTGLSSVEVTTNVELDLGDYFNNSWNSYPYEIIRKIGVTLTPPTNSLNGTFMNWKGLVEAPLISISPVNLSNTFYGCTELVNVPLYNASALVQASNTFFNCLKLNDTSLDNILQMCANTPSNYAGTKTLAFLGITNTTVYSASRIQALPHYNDFINAGWSIS